MRHLCEAPWVAVNNQKAFARNRLVASSNQVAQDQIGLAAGLWVVLNLSIDIGSFSIGYDPRLSLDT